MESTLQKMKIKVQAPMITRQSSIEVNINDTRQEFIAPIEATSPPGFSNLIMQAGKALKKLPPTLVEEGLGGTYFFHGEGSNVLGVFKPTDEDALSLNNPKGYYSPSVRRFKENFSSGETSIRECAAYLLDIDNFSGVPATDLVICHHPAFSPNRELIIYPSQTPYNKLQGKFKVGSFQEFKNNHGSLEDIGTTALPIEEVHKIALLDIRIANTDRHEGNILYRKDKNPLTGNIEYNLIPIDHAFSLPCDFSDIWFCWRNWSQAKEKMSDRTKAYIAKLDIEKDIQLLQSKFPDVFNAKHFFVMRVMNALLQYGAQLDLSFYDLACIICPPSQGQISRLEEIVETFQSLPQLITSAEAQQFFYNTFLPILISKIQVGK